MVSDQTVGSLLELLRKYVPSEMDLERLMTDLGKVPGSKSFRNVVELLQARHSRIASVSSLRQSRRRAEGGRGSTTKVAQ